MQYPLDGELQQLFHAEALCDHRRRNLGIDLFRGCDERQKRS